MIKLAPSEQYVLRQLKGGPAFGMDLVASSNGLLARSSMYVLLGGMEAGGLIHGTEVPMQGSSGFDSTPIRRRRYEITGVGEQALALHDSGVRGHEMLARFDLIVARAREEFRCLLEAGHVPMDIEVTTITRSHVQKTVTRAPFWEPAISLKLGTE